MPYGGVPQQRQGPQQSCFDKVKMGAMMGFSIGINYLTLSPYFKIITLQYNF